MAISDRLKDERLRLGLSQSAFGELAGVTKSAQIKWERGGSSAPTAPALAAWAEAGADVLYIVTGKRTNERPENAVTQIEDQLAAIRRDILEPVRRLLPGQSEPQAEKIALERHTSALKAILNYDTAFLTPELRHDVEHLLDVVENPASLSLYRAADYAQHRSKRGAMKDDLWGWFNADTYYPAETVVNLLATVAIDYRVPVKLIVELVEEVYDDVKRKTEPSGDMEPKR